MLYALLCTLRCAPLRCTPDQDQDPDQTTKQTTKLTTKLTTKTDTDDRTRYI